MLFLILLIPFQVRAQNSIAGIIQQHKNEWHYPLSVQRFYQQEGFRLVWILKDTVKTPVWDAMLLLECVPQYGLNTVDFYPQELTYDNLHQMQTGNAGDNEKAYFDVKMTDAIITLINYLHYGKLNPYFPKSKIDARSVIQFRADARLIDALDQKELIPAILVMQPHSEAYILMQSHMQLLTTKYSGSNYVKPVHAIHQLAINMERLRWINTTGKTIRLTCVVRDGLIIEYKDIYKQDRKLERAFYYTIQPAITWERLLHPKNQRCSI